MPVTVLWSGTIQVSGELSGNALYRAGGTLNAYSLDVDNDIVGDPSVPAITGVTSPNANNSFTVGATIYIDVTFDGPVEVSGSPRLLLSTGASGRYAVYSSGSGTSTIRFAYAVQSGDNVSSLEYLGTDSLNLNGGAITDSSWTNVNTTLPAVGQSGSLGSNNITLDTTSPLVASISLADPNPTNARTLHFTVTFSESVTGVDLSDFTLCRLGAQGTITSVTGSGTTYTVTVDVTSANVSSRLWIRLIDNDSIVDAVGNALGGSGAGNGNYNSPAYIFTG
jgi:hypothetical protein